MVRAAFTWMRPRALGRGSDTVICTSQPNELRNVIGAIAMPYFWADPLDYATPSRSSSAANCSRFMMAMP
jgi:hypothetical protein